MITKKCAGERLLEIDNVHFSGCGSPPSLDAADKYVGYFENPYGEQWVFIGDPAWRMKLVVLHHVPGQGVQAMSLPPEAPEEAPRLEGMGLILFARDMEKAQEKAAFPQRCGRGAALARCRSDAKAGEWYSLLVYRSLPA